MNRLTLRSRIFLSYLALIIPAAIVLVLFVNRQLTEAIDDIFYGDFEEDSGILLERAEELTESTFVDGTVDDEAALQELRRLADDLDMHLQILVLDGSRVYFDSQLGGTVAYAIPPPNDLISLIEFNESIDVLDEESGTVYQSYYVTIGDEAVAIARIGRTTNQMQQQRRTRSTALIVGTVVAAAVLAVGMGSLMAQTLTRPLTKLRQTAQAMAQGNLDSRAATDAPQELAELAQDFNNMAEAVEAMVLEQKAFAGNAAHELRTPLTAIRLRTEALLEDEPDAAMTREYIEEIDAEARRLSRLVEDLRLLARVDANRVDAGREMVDLGQIIRTLRQEYATQLSQKRLTWRSDIEPDLPTVEAGLNHMHVIMRNVIDNAIKYTPEGGEIVVSAESDADTLRVTVRDSGIGISAEDLPHLFTRFYRVEKSRNRAVPGSGLGLEIVQSMLALYNGSISVESDGLGHGTTATLTFPIGNR